MRQTALLLALAGCGPQPELVPGELGNGMFYWLCTALSDPSCESLEQGAMDFPSAVALGSDFELQYQSNGGRYLPVYSGSSHLERAPSGTFTAMLPGFASIVVYEDGEVFDFLHLVLSPVLQLQISSTGLPSEGLEVGDEAQLQVNPVCGVTGCGGALPYQWSVDRTDVIELQSAVGPDNVVTVRALSPGLATISVLADTVGIIQIEVLGDTPVETGLDETGLEETGLEETGLEETGVGDTGVEDTGAEDTGVGP